MGGRSHPTFDRGQDAKPREIKIVVDCSGSMNGDSIDQAREALRRIIESLRPQDRFNIIAFGSRYRLLFDHSQPASAGNLMAARRFVQDLRADLGGTEMATALAATYATSVSSPETAPAVLLITDGEIYDAETSIVQAVSSGHSVFVVGVGSSVNEAFLCDLAERTGGAAEFVTPRENMAERVYRQFQRLYAPRLEIRWPLPPTTEAPAKLKTVFRGDTLHAFAWFETQPSDEVELHLTMADGSRHRMVATLAPLPCTGENGIDLLARMGAAHRLRETGDDRLGLDLSLRYRLLGPFTNYLIIDERASSEQTTGLPSLRVVPQMLAVGWGGFGSAKRMSSDLRPMAMARAVPSPFARASLTNAGGVSSSPNSRKISGDSLDIPAFLRRSGETRPAKRVGPAEQNLRKTLSNVTASRSATESQTNQPKPQKRRNALEKFIVVMDFRYYRTRSVDFDITSIDDLRRDGLPNVIASRLQDLVDRGREEKEVVLAFLKLLLESDVDRQFSVHVRLLIEEAWNTLGARELDSDDKVSLMSSIPSAGLVNNGSAIAD